ncbi:MAG: hypothetical protein KCHDKBKB_00743 [Elusimicrobia bacterium]|nr:hypothetical protein [Elusimicrobiota bacterium]
MTKKKLSPSSIAIKSDNVLDEIMGKKKIEKFNTNLFENKSRQVLQDEYDAARKKHIASELSLSWNKDKNRDDIEAQWDAEYPRGLDDWLKNYRILNSYGQQQLIDKVNEIIDELNRR